MDSRTHWGTWALGLAALLLPGCTSSSDTVDEEPTATASAELEY
jgi:hypothetical protein